MLKESVADALVRGLREECGIDVPSERKAGDRSIHVRSHRYIGALTLPAHRQGERPVADDAPGTALETIKLRAKAYWMATVLLRSREDVAPAPDGNEIKDLRWFTLEEAEEMIRSTNQPEKAELLLAALESCRMDVTGGLKPSGDVPVAAVDQSNGQSSGSGTG